MLPGFQHSQSDFVYSHCSLGSNLVKFRSLPCWHIRLTALLDQVWLRIHLPDVEAPSVSKRQRERPSGGGLRREQAGAPRSGAANRSRAGPSLWPCLCPIYLLWWNGQSFTVIFRVAFSSSPSWKQVQSMLMVLCVFSVKRAFAREHMCPLV